jgi:DUF438 domain-containing protein
MMNGEGELTEERKEALKEMVRKLHEGADPGEMKAQFKDLIEQVGPDQISKLEEELIEEGMEQKEMHRLCDVHIEVFKEQLEKGEPLAPLDHPIGILMREHEMFKEFMCIIQDASEVLRTSGTEPDAEAMGKVDHIIGHLKDAEVHYVREENVLFPYLEKHGVTGPPAIMWMDHDQIRERKKALFALVEDREKMAHRDFSESLGRECAELGELMTNHFYKENNILFPTALTVIEGDEWTEIRRQFDEFGYCCFTPEPVEGAETAPAEMGEGEVVLDTGTLSLAELEAILNRLPIDISFVDAEDRVVYFNDAPDRIFPRAKAIIGRTVQGCHPDKSMHMVQKILDEMRNGDREEAEFWIDMGDKKILIQYFAVRDRNGKYLGVLEASQDIAGIQRITGQKRLL